MPITVTHPIIKVMNLTKSDKAYKNEGEPTVVTVRQARQAEHDVRLEIWALTRQVYDDKEPGRVETIRNMSLAALRIEEVWLTLCGSNIIDDEGKLLFPSKEGKDSMPKLALTKEQFKTNWGILFPDIADEIHEKCLDMNPKWRGQEGEAS